MAECLGLDASTAARFGTCASLTLFLMIFPGKIAPAVIHGTTDDQNPAPLHPGIPRPSWETASLCAPTRIAAGRPPRSSGFAGVHASLSGCYERPSSTAAHTKGGNAGSTRGGIL